MANTNIILKHGDQLTVTVQDDPVTPQPNNRPPMVSTMADAEIKLPVSSIELYAQSSDPDNDSLNYQWSKVSGPPCSFVSPTAIKTQVNGMVATGDYVFRLTVNDGRGGSASDDTKITVKPADVVTPPNPGKVDYLNLPTSGKIIAKAGQVIDGLQFKNMADIAIRVGDVANVTIKNCFFNGSGAEAIEIERSSNVTITNCLFARMTCGVYALDAQTIKVNSNQFVNTRLRSGGGRGQFVQFDNVSGSGNEVKDNQGENFAGESNPEDMVSLYRSSGTSSSPITVSGNMFRGGGPSASGGGLMSGDSGGSWQLTENNKLLNPGNYAVAIAGGSNIIVRNNQSYQELKPWSNIGGYAYGGQQGAACSNATFTGNNLFATSPEFGVNNYYFGDESERCTNSDLSGNISTITIEQLNFPDHLITFITPAELLTIRK